MSDAWAEWLSLPAPTFGHPEAECHAAALLGLLRQRPSVELLERILVGDNLVAVDRRTVRRDQAAAEVQAWKASGSFDHVKVEGVSALPVVDVVGYRRAPNLYELARDREISRGWLVQQLEAVCRCLLPDNLPAGLSLGRQIFQHALMTGKPPKSHHCASQGRDEATIVFRNIEPHHSVGQGRRV
jgi:hypothetical protein